MGNEWNGNAPGRDQCATTDVRGRHRAAPPTGPSKSRIPIALGVTIAAGAILPVVVSNTGLFSGPSNVPIFATAIPSTATSKLIPPLARDEPAPDLNTLSGTPLAPAEREQPEPVPVPEPRPPAERAEPPIAQPVRTEPKQQAPVQAVAAKARPAPIDTAAELAHVVQPAEVARPAGKAPEEPVRTAHTVRTFAGHPVLAQSLFAVFSATFRDSPVLAESVTAVYAERLATPEESTVDLLELVRPVIQGITDVLTKGIAHALDHIEHPQPEPETEQSNGSADPAR
ncbi:hypothetical protein [Amycolatopsis anabasis]|uniref:hypothetical protein n=1 Tax=Amycolatopsis anabasis TaxID=1840409 RepID=UPI00131E5A10|nr:hypothetical protein [Amycolatopsis anabasis]